MRISAALTCSDSNRVRSVELDAGRRDRMREKGRMSDAIGVPSRSRRDDPWLE
jgi:hypothetical protein